MLIFLRQTMFLGNTVSQLFCCYYSSLIPVLNLVYFYISTFRSMCAVPNMAVFYISLTSWFPGVVLTYFLNDFEIVPVAPINTGIAFVFALHLPCISIVRSLFFIIFQASFLITFLSPEIATSINIHVPFSLSRITMFIIIISSSSSSSSSNRSSNTRSGSNTSSPCFTPYCVPEMVGVNIKSRKSYMIFIHQNTGIGR